MLNDVVKWKGRVQVRRFNEAGELTAELDFPNLVVTAGLASLAERIAIGATTAMSHMAVGTNATPAALADTALGTEVARVALTSVAAVGAVITYTASYGAGVGTGTLTEVGLFNAAAAGTMQARALFSAALPKGAADTVSITWTLTQG